jgi:hypothetical protein
LPFSGVATKEDGSYRVVGLPGPGLVAVRSSDDYLRAPDREDEEGARESELRTAPYAISFTSNYSAIARIDPAKDIDRVTRDVTLDPGWTFTGTVLGPDGKPLAGARRLTGMRWWDVEGMKTAEFAVQGLDPRRPREILLQHPGKGLIGVAQPPKNKGGAVTVQMQPGAWLTGRLVDADGLPRAGVELEVAFRTAGRPALRWQGYSPGRIKTDPEGRFHIQALFPGYDFRLSDGKGTLTLGGITLRPGRANDLGDVMMEAGEE